VSSGAATAVHARERIVVYGPECLGDEELVALALGGRDALDRARALLEHVGGLRGLAEALPHELVCIEGIGEAAALALAATTELARRFVRASAPRGLVIRNPEEVVEYVRAELVAATREHFLVIGLDARQRVKLVRTIAVGSLAQVDVHPRELFRPLVRAGVHSTILVHNHPSGDPRPSEADLALTRRMIDVGRLVGIPVLDHLIVCDDAHVSLAALGLVT
jgi:DNA repair protein RadC